ncbi:MAG: hypothetical protein ABSF99_13450 [Anaerolineales bacterium]
MSNFIHTTRECTASQLNPRLSQAIREYFQMHQVGDVDTGTIMCCETISEKRNTRKLASILEGNPDTRADLAIILTAAWLIWARSGDRSGTVVSGAKLKVIQVKAFVSRRTKDMELEINGFINDSKEYVRGRLQMGPELAAQKFCEEVGQAVSKGKPPSKRNFFGLITN